MDIKTANRLYELRKQHGYSQDELADMLNVSRQAVSKWERSESSPDTDNLIALARLYNVSLDELLGFKNEADCAENDVNNNKNTASSDDCDNSSNNDGSVHIDENGVRIGNEVHIDQNGIHVRDKNGEKVHITGNVAKFVNKLVGDIHVNGTDDDDDNDDDVIEIKDGHIVGKHPTLAIKAIISGITLALCTAAYLTIGFVCKLWHPGWLLFLVPMIVDGCVEAIIKKNPHAFPIPIIATATYLLLGCGWGMWHPYWAVMCVIPAYYIVVSSIKSAAKTSKEKEVTIELEYNNDEDDTDNN